MNASSSQKATYDTDMLQLTFNTPPLWVHAGSMLQNTHGGAHEDQNQAWSGDGSEAVRFVNLYKAVLSIPKRPCSPIEALQ